MKSIIAVVALLGATASASASELLEGDLGLGQDEHASVDLFQGRERGPSAGRGQSGSRGAPAARGSRSTTARPAAGGSRSSAGPARGSHTTTARAPVGGSRSTAPARGSRTTTARPANAHGAPYGGRPSTGAPRRASPQTQTAYRAAPVHRTGAHRAPPVHRAAPPRGRVVHTRHATRVVVHAPRVVVHAPRVVVHPHRPVVHAYRPPVVVAAPVIVATAPMVALPVAGHVTYTAAPVQAAPKTKRGLDRKGSFALGVRSGSYLTSYQDGSSSLYGDFGLGLTARYRPYAALGIEASFAHHNQTFSEGTERSQTIIQPSVMVFVAPTSHVSPYFLGGLTYNARSMNDAFQTSNGVGLLQTKSDLFGPHAGVGLEFSFGKHVSFDIEARYIAYINAGGVDPTRAGALQTNAGFLVHF